MTNAEVITETRVPEDAYASWSPSPRPDGAVVAFVSDRGGEPAIWLTGPEGDTPRTWAPLPSPLRRVMSVSWSPDGRRLACVVAAAGGSRTEVWITRPDGSATTMVAGAAPASADLGAGTGRGWTRDGRLLLTVSAEESEALLVDPASGERRMIARAPLLRLLDASRDGHRALLRCGPRTQHWLAIADVDGGPPRRLPTGSGPGSTERGCLSPDGRVVYCATDTGRELPALLAVDVGGGGGEADAQVLAERADAGLEDLVVSPDGRRLALLWNVEGGRSEITVYDLIARQEQALTAALPRDVIDDVSFGPDGSELLLTAQSWSDPRGVWRIDLADQGSVPLSSPDTGRITSSRGAGVSGVEAAQLTAPELRRLRSHDGLALTGWLYRPAGQPPWPTLIYLHGGPEAQERPVYNSLFQSLVAAGVAVFAPNVRGSSGFGRSFVTADDRHGRYGAIRDVATCAQHLAAGGIAEPGRIGCMGRSYGGYLTLAALVWHPELFAVGVVVCGIADFETFFARTEPWIAAAAASKYGDPVADRALLRDLSPLHRIDRVAAPVLVVHGAQDTNVPVHEAEQLVRALAARGAEHAYLRFDDEGHEILATANRVTLVRTSVEWVGRHLAVAEPGVRHQKHGGEASGR